MRLLPVLPLRASHLRGPKSPTSESQPTRLAPTSCGVERLAWRPPAGVGLRNQKARLLFCSSVQWVWFSFFPRQPDSRWVMRKWKWFQLGNSAESVQKTAHLDGCPSGVTCEGPMVQRRFLPPAWQNSAAVFAYLPLLMTRRFSCLDAGGLSLEPWGFLTLASSGLPLSLFCAAVDRRTLKCLCEKARVVKYSTKWRVEWVSLLGVMNCRMDLYSIERKEGLTSGFFFMLSTPAVERSFSVGTTDLLT